MDEPRITPPLPIDGETQEVLLKSLDEMTELDRFLLDYKTNHDPYIQEKYIRPLKNRDKERKRRNRRRWWRDNWIAFFCLLFSFIAAIPVIIQGIETILGWLG